MSSFPALVPKVCSYLSCTVYPCAVLSQLSVCQLLITIDKTSGCTVTDVTYLSLEMEALEAEITVRTWHVQAQVRLGFIQVLDNDWKGSFTIRSAVARDWYM